MSDPKPKGDIKIVGGRNIGSYGERFDRLQRRAHLLLGRGVCPKGVFRFRTYEEFDEWKKQNSLQNRPNETTS
jgi:hypothetical protein